MEIFLIILALLLVILLLSGRAGSNENRKAVPIAPSPQKSRRDKLYGVLLTQVLGDHRKAQRLIAFEKRKDPKHETGQVCS